MKQKLLLLLASILVVLVVDFFVKKIFNNASPRKTFAEPTYNHPFRIPVSAFHHGFKPRYAGMENRIPYFINSLGGRDRTAREVSLKKTKTRVIFLGDSFTEGIGVPFEKTFVGLLQERNPELELLNLGVTSYCPSLAAAKIKHLADQGLEFDSVILLIDVSDIEDELLYEYNGKDGAQQKWLKKDRPFENRELEWISQAFIISEETVEKETLLLGAVFRNVRLSLEPLVREFGFNLPWTRDGWTEFQGAYEKQIQEALSKINIALQGIKEVADSQSANLKVVIYPWTLQLSTGKKPSRGEYEFERICKSQGVELINFYPDIRKLEKTYAEQYCFDNDSHWNEKGHQLIAELFVQHRVFPTSEK